MTASAIISFVIFGLTALIMIGIGVSQLKSKEPVGFYSGEQPPSKEELTDVAVWNKKHGIMWLAYGVVILLSYGIAALLGDSAWSILPICGGLLVPVLLMIWYHHRLRKKYMRQG